jgi:hypothetical protein
VGEEIDRLKDGDEAAVVQFGESAEILWNWDQRRQPLAAAIRERLKPSFSLTSYREGLRKAAELLKTASNSERELCLITDLQASGLTSRDQEDLSMDHLTSFRLKAVGTDSPNTHVSQVRLNREVFQPEYPYAIQVQVISSPPLQDRKEVALFLEGELIDRQICDIGSGGNGAVQFDPFDLPPGISRGRIVVNNEDAVSADDVYYFVLERKEPFVVTLLQGDDSASIYFEEALSSGRNLPFRINRVKSLTQVRRAESPVLVLDDVSLPPSEKQLLPFLEEGGGVILCPGKHADSSQYNRRLNSLLPAAMKEREFAHGRKVPFFKIDEANWEHPVFAGMADSLSGVHFYGYWGLEELERGQITAQFDTGGPLLAEASVGKGRVLVFTASLGRVWSDFPVSNSYLPFWQRMVQYAAGWKRQASAFSVNEILPSENDQSERQGGSSADWEVLDPEGQRLFALSGESARNVLLEIPGYYEIRSERDTDWVAVNCDRSESDLSRMESAEMLAFLESLREQSNVRQELIPDEAPEQALWGVMLLLALLLLYVESILANGLLEDSSVNSNLRGET